jgi:hypothetical protein
MKSKNGAQLSQEKLPITRQMPAKGNCEISSLFIATGVFEDFPGCLHVDKGLIDIAIFDSLKG